MRHKSAGLDLFVLFALLVSVASVSAYEHAKALPEAGINAEDSLDPNDCTRGIDEANQATCDQGGAQ